MEQIYIKGAEKPPGHYTPGIKSGSLIFVSGQIPVDPFTGERCTGTVEEQTARALQNVKLVLESGGSAIDKVVKANVYVSDIDNWDKVNAAYVTFFGNHKPARIVVPTTKLHYGILVEIDVIAEV